MIVDIEDKTVDAIKSMVGTDNIQDGIKILIETYIRTEELTQDLIDIKLHREALRDKNDMMDINDFIESYCNDC